MQRLFLFFGDIGPCIRGGMFAEKRPLVEALFIVKKNRMIGVKCLGDRVARDSCDICAGREPYTL